MAHKKRSLSQIFRRATVPFVIVGTGIASACTPPAPPAGSVVAGGLVAVENIWPNGSEFQNVDFKVQVLNDGGSRANYFWANQFSFQNGDIGYIGLQNVSGVKKAVFSIWGATGWVNQDGIGACKNFTNEGTGKTCQAQFNWKTGDVYKMNITKNGNNVTATITNTADGTQTRIGTLTVSPSWGAIKGTSGFVEEFSQGSLSLPSCSAISPQSSVFQRPINENGVSPTQHSFTYGPCGSLATSTCETPDNSCTNTVNMGAPTPIQAAMRTRTAPGLG